MNKLLSNDYKGKPVNSRQGRPFDPWSCRGVMSIEPLPLLHGKQWDDLALGLIHALRPTQLRVVAHNEGTQLDGELWRVTVQLNEDNTIYSIQQEVQIGLPDGVTCGNSFDAAMEYGLQSKQVKWYQGNIDRFYSDIEGNFFKICDGKMIPFPK